MGRKAAALSALPELWRVRRPAETSPGVATPEVYAAGLTLNEKAGAAFTGSAGVVRCQSPQSGANGIADSGSVGFPTKCAASSRIGPDRFGSNPRKATRAIAMVPQ
jgi:hypothetical protein